MSLGTAQDMHTVTPGEGLSAALRQGFPNPQSYVPMRGATRSHPATLATQQE